MIRLRRLSTLTFSALVLLLVSGADAQTADLPIVPLNKCGVLTQSARYVVTKDLSSATGTCLTASNLSNFSIDCRRHRVISKSATTSIQVSDASDFSISSCRLSAIPATGILPTLWLLRVQRARILANSMAGMLVGSSTILDPNDRSSTLLVQGNSFTSTYFQFNVFNSAFQRNTVSVRGDKTGYLGGIWSSWGGYNQILNNLYDGHYRGRGSPSAFTASDDGIVLSGESNDIIANNTLKNFYDCGIETVGQLNNSIIDGNIITGFRPRRLGISLCGIGAWYGTSWSNNIIKSNLVRNTQHLFIFYRLFELLRGESQIRFVNNAFLNNAYLSKPVYSPGLTGGLSSFFFDVDSINLSFGINPGISEGLGGEVSSIVEGDLVVNGNVFQNNLFGTPPDRLPAAGFLDLGGNTIVTPNAFPRRTPFSF